MSGFGRGKKRNSWKGDEELYPLKAALCLDPRSAWDGGSWNIGRELESSKIHTFSLRASLLFGYFGKRGV